MSFRKTSLGMMHLAREMYRDVTHMETVDVPEKFCNRNFILHLMLGTGETSRRNERVHALHENFAEFRFEGTRYRGDSNIYIYGALKYLTNLKNHLTVNLERFMRRSVFALYRGISRTGIRTITNGITNEHQNEDEVEFVDKKASNERTNEASVIRAVIQERRTILGLADPIDKIPELKKNIRKDTIASSCDISCFCTESPNAVRR